jgi:hypothetical protein
MSSGTSETEARLLSVVQCRAWKHRACDTVSFGTVQRVVGRRVVVRPFFAPTFIVKSFRLTAVHSPPPPPGAEVEINISK